MKNKKILWILIIVILCIAGTGLAFFDRIFGTKTNPYSTIPFTLAKRSDFEILLSEVGRLDALKSKTVTSKVQGKITKLVAEGALVTQNQEIVWLDTSDLDKINVKEVILWTGLKNRFCG